MVKARDDRFHEECGIFGVFAPDDDVANLTYFGLYALQHRGQESAGICVGDGRRLNVVKEMGLVAQAFDQAALDSLTGHAAIGHTRYSTTGAPQLINAQPMLFAHPTIGEFAIAHNGNLTNTAVLREWITAQGVPLDSTSDTEVIGRLLALTPGTDLPDVMAKALPRLEGAYCLALITPHEVFAVRDPRGIRPLCIGRLGDVAFDDPGGNGYVIASETCALDVVGAQHIDEVKPGEIVCIGNAGMRRLPFGAAVARTTCSFEFIYFARPDSEIDGISLYEARRAMGRRLAEDEPVDADIVIAMPDSGTPAAVGYAERSGIPFVDGLIKSRYITRTFIEPSPKLRARATQLKFNPMRHVLRGKRVVLVDDSIVRGTASRHIVDELRKAGALEVHLRVASPPIQWPCFLGIDMATRRELIAANHSVEEIREIVGADSLCYLGLAGLRDAVGATPGGRGFCFACFTGDYPVDVSHLMPARAQADVPLSGKATEKDASRV